MGTRKLSDLLKYLSMVKPGRKITGIAAALLPLDEDGRISEDAYVRHLQATQSAGLTNAVNMDTGYVNYLSDEEKLRVLGLARDALGSSVRFIAGAYIEGKEGDPVSLYRAEIERILEFGGTPILFQSARIHGKSAAEKVAVYREVCKGLPEVLGFELGRMFAPNGEIFDEETVAGLMEIPELTGMKHSSLDKVTELERLQIRDKIRPEFRIYTGNDLGIDMIEYGSDYLLGLATFCPEKFAERDRMWETGDPAYFGLGDALQHLGNVAFRAPVPAYKHSAAAFLQMCGRIPTSRTHPRSHERPAWECEILADCASRLGLAVT